MANVQPQPAPRPQDPGPGTPTQQRLLQWAAEHLLRDGPRQAVLDTLAVAGFDSAASQALLLRVESDPVFAAARSVLQSQRKLQAVVANLQTLWELAPGYLQVDRRESVSEDEFLGRYVSGCRPLVITGLARDWPALQRWTPQALAQTYGHLPVAVQRRRHGDPGYEQNKDQHRSIEPLGEFIASVLASGPSNDMYMTANDEVLRRPEFAPLLNDIGNLPPWCSRAALPGACSLWLGPAGTVTPLHHDTLMLFHTQILGRKRWQLISPLELPKLYNRQRVFSPVDPGQPDLARFPAFAGVKVLDVVVEPGETMFLPLGWWHQVSSLDVSVSFSFTNVNFPNQFGYPDP